MRIYAVEIPGKGWTVQAQDGTPGSDFFVFFTSLPVFSSMNATMAVAATMVRDYKRHGLEAIERLPNFKPY